MSVLDSIKSLLKDPPPEFAFEVSAEGIAMARTDGEGRIQFAALPAGALTPHPVQENVRDTEAFGAALARLLPAGLRGKRGAALILPDNSVRITILDFESIPVKEEERTGLIRFRLRKMLPFDLESSRISYSQIGPKRVLVAVALGDVIAQYEAPFRAAGLHPGLVTVSAISSLELIPPKTSAIVAKVSSGVLTVTVLHAGGILLIRSLDLDAHTADPMEEISNDLYPTLAYVEDNTGTRPEKLVIAGFGDQSEAAATRLAVELELPVEAISERHPGVAGYLASMPTAPPKRTATKRVRPKKEAA